MKFNEIIGRGMTTSTLGSYSTLGDAAYDFYKMIKSSGGILTERNIELMGYEFEIATRTILMSNGKCSFKEAAKKSKSASSQLINLLKREVQ